MLFVGVLALSVSHSLDRAGLRQRVSADREVDSF